jgi:exonuclease VII small subunit
LTRPCRPCRTGWKKWRPLPRLEAPLQEISQRLEKLETAPPAFSRDDFEAPLQELSQRLEKLEKVHAELLAELHAKPPEPPSPEPPEPYEPAVPVLSAPLLGAIRIIRRA